MCAQARSMRFTLIPPYNTRDKDWKYNNDYVDNDDYYKHSKWLAFMEQRLKLAKHLLNPKDSVLIVTIDDNEVHRLGLLLEQTFRGAAIQMVTTVINPRGKFRAGAFARSDEYLLFVTLGTARVAGERDIDYSEGAAVPMENAPSKRPRLEKGQQEGRNESNLPDLCG
jgi:adenine-specific DNA-methyltransferase